MQDENVSLVHSFDSQNLILFLIEQCPFLRGFNMSLDSGIGEKFRWYNSWTTFFFFQERIYFNVLHFPLLLVCPACQLLTPLTVQLIYIPHFFLSIEEPTKIWEIFLAFAIL